jgi:hypothetical protein
MLRRRLSWLRAEADALLALLVRQLSRSTAAEIDR